MRVHLKALGANYQHLQLSQNSLSIFFQTLYIMVLPASNAGGGKNEKGFSTILGSV